MSASIVVVVVVGAGTWTCCIATQGVSAPAFIVDRAGVAKKKILALARRGPGVVARLRHHETPRIVVAPGWE